MEIARKGKEDGEWGMGIGEWGVKYFDFERSEKSTLLSLQTTCHSERSEETSLRGAVEKSDEVRKLNFRAMVDFQCCDKS